MINHDLLAGIACKGHADMGHKLCVSQKNDIDLRPTDATSHALSLASMFTVHFVFIYNLR